LIPAKTVVVNGFIWSLADNGNLIKQNTPRSYGFWRIYADFQMVEAAGIEPSFDDTIYGLK